MRLCDPTRSAKTSGNRARTRASPCSSQNVTIFLSLFFRVYLEPHCLQIYSTLSQVEYFFDVSRCAKEKPHLVCSLEEGRPLRQLSLAVSVFSLTEKINPFPLHPHPHSTRQIRLRHGLLQSLSFVISFCP